LVSFFGSGFDFLSRRRHKLDDETKQTVVELQLSQIGGEYDANAVCSRFHPRSTDGRWNGEKVAAQVLGYLPCYGKRVPCSREVVDLGHHLSFDHEECNLQDAFLSIASAENGLPCPGNTLSTFRPRSFFKLAS